jgi:hypothetical protein
MKETRRSAGCRSESLSSTRTRTSTSRASITRDSAEGHFTNMASHDLPLSILRSGSNTTYMLARTKQFQRMLAEIENSYDGDGAALEERRRAFSNGMENTFEAAYQAALEQQPGDFPGAVEAAGIAVAQKYHLLYYKGTGANLRRIGGGPPVKR